MKCVDAALVLLRLQGIRIKKYIDDWLILAQSHQLAVWHRDVVLAHMKKLGLWLNAKKSVLSPLQRTTFLGVICRVGYRLGGFRYRCQIDTFKTVPVPKRWLNRYLQKKKNDQLIIGLAISTKHMGPVSQTGLKLNWISLQLLTL